MQIKVYATLDGMRAVLSAPASERRAAYRAHIIEPLRDYWQPIISAYQPEFADNDDALRSMLWNFDLQADETVVAEHLAMLTRLEQANAWQVTGNAIRKAVQSIEAVGQTCQLEQAAGLLLLGNPRDEIFMQRLKGSVGAGGANGSFIVNIWPTEENLPRLPSVVVHEFHHKVRLAYEPWQMTSLNEYLVLEGLAESFARELYGERSIGPWVTMLTPEEVVQAKGVIGAALGRKGDIRGYIFGDLFAEQFHYPPVGLPYCAGYTIGYQLVQAYLRATGKTVAEATFIPSEEIVRVSPLFL